MINFIHDRQRNLLLYEQQHVLPDLLYRNPSVLLPDKSAVIEGYYVVPSHLKNCQVLSRWQLPVPPVIDGSYDWPRDSSVEHPYESQRTATNYTVLNPRCYNLSDMGCGKTLSALWAADWLMTYYKPEPFRALVVAPLSILERVWANAISRHLFGRRTFEILHGSAAQRERALAKDVDFYIINHDGICTGLRTRPKFELHGFSLELANRRDIRLVVIDEASAFRDSQTRRHKTARQNLTQREYLWLMTGTPTPNAPTDAYGLAKLVNNAKGKSWTGFRFETMQQQSPFKWIPKPDGYEKARQLLQPAIRYGIEQVWDGPPMTTQQREVPLTEEQKKLIALLKRDLEAELASGAAITAVNEAGLRTKYLQIAAGAAYDDGHVAHETGATARITEINDILDECAKKVLIFASFTGILELLLRKVKYKCEIVNGAVSQKERSRIFAEFQGGDKLSVLLLDPMATAHGLDLYAARTVIWATPTDKVELYQQGCKRAHRPGQKYPVTVIQVVSTALEREIYKRLERSAGLQGALLDAVRRGEL